MRITKIEAIPVAIPLKPERRMISALGRHDVSQFAVIRITTDQGIIGAGEATVTPRWSGETVWSACSIIEHVFAPSLIGHDPTDTLQIYSIMDALAFGNWFAKAAVEMACWDIAGKAEEKPIYHLLGGACRPLTIKNRFSLGAYEPSLAKERAIELVAQGFNTIKVKVGTDPNADVARVKAVRDGVGPDISLTIDANGGWDEATALECLKQLDSSRLTIVEQPLPRGNYHGLIRVRRDSGQKILADESCFDEVEAVELAEHQCCDAISVYPGKAGGIVKARRIAAIAESHGLPCTIGSNLEWDLGAAAMMHFIVATPNMRVDLYPGDCLGPSYHEFSLAKNPINIKWPFTTIGSAPGLGVEVDWDMVEKHRIR